MKIKKKDLDRILHEEYSMFKEVSQDTSSISFLYLFDFDDTLAETENVVGVKYIDHETGEVSGEDSLSSDEFETYRQKSEEERASDVLDFSDFDNVKNPVPIDNVVKIMKHALVDSKSFVAIITARPSNAAKEIFDFLKGHGIGISMEHINTVGDSGGKPEHKLDVAKKYVERFFPDEVHYYDDSQKNNDAIITLCDNISKEIEVFTYDVVSGSPVPVDTCGTYDSKRMMEIAGII